MEGTIFNIEHFAIHDGPGIRTTVFMKGCPLCCLWCHNPEGLTPKVQRIRLDDNTEEIIGKRMTPEEVIAEVEKDELFYDESGGGVTFSGGEPLMQPDFLEECLKLAKKSRLHTALETTGFASHKVIERIAPYVDLFLYDMKPINSELHRKYTGVDNQIVKDNLRYLSSIGANIILRMVAIPGVNDSKEIIEEFARFFKENHIQDVNLLPLHKSATEKYRKLKREFLIKDYEIPSEEKMQWWKAQYEAYGFRVKIGG